MKKLFTVLAVLALLFYGCDTNKEKTLMDSATAKAKAKNYSEAMKDYQKIIDEYPSSDNAAESYFAIAAMYHMYQIPNIPKEESIKKAVQYYEKLYAEFPKNEKSPKALFMSAYLKGNELSDIEGARKSYQTFIDKYPGNELIPQAKIELQNLGKTPEEILQASTAKK
jgi:TolA-binding protein